MRHVEISKVKPGMRLARTLYNEAGSLELLQKGSVLTDRHIKMLLNMGILAVMVEDEGVPQILSKVPSTPTLNADTIEKAALAEGVDFDVQAFKQELEEVEAINFMGDAPSSVNRQMPVPVLTGENNIPLDEKYEVVLQETKQVFEKLRTSNDLDLKSVRENVAEMLPDMIRNNDVLMRLSQLQKSDDYTFDHSFRVSVLAAMIGKWLGYDEKTLEELASASLLFDIGKMKVPEFVLHRPSVTEDEMEVIKRHVQLGYTLLLKTEGVTSNIKYAALHHHERMDGSGYPLRLKSGQIHEFAKIIMVCDIFDAMTNDRPYRKKVSVFQAAEYISWQSGATLDPQVCHIFLRNISEYFVGKPVLLSTEEVGRIIHVDVNFPTRPTVAVAGRTVDMIQEKDVRILEMLNS